MATFLHQDDIRIVDGRPSVFVAETVQIAPFRNLMSGLKDMLVQTNLYLTSDGIFLFSMDRTKTVMMHLSLQAENFEKFYCKEQIVVGVNIQNLFKFISPLETHETLTIFIEEEDYNNGVVHMLSLLFYNEAKGSQIIQKVNLIDADATERSYTDYTYSSVLCMPSSDFQRYVKCMQHVSENVIIQSVGNEIIFQSSGDLGASIIRHRDTTKENKPEDVNMQNIIQGEFSIHNLGFAVKCTGMCNQVEINLENDCPMVIKYPIASLGDIRLCIGSRYSSMGGSSAAGVSVK